MSPHGITRFSISMDRQLVRRLDSLVQTCGFASRSQAVSQLVRDRLVQRTAEHARKEIAGTITLVYDHHKARLQPLLTSIQHDHHERIISTLHVHLDHDHCLEVLVVRGPSREVRGIADQVIAVKGVKHGTLTVTTTGRNLP
jgi:CopG family nickel-responsive transcriptional regulator